MNKQIVSVLVEGREIQPGLYELQRVLPNVTYGDPKRGWIIRSIGQRVSDGKIFAAVDIRFADNPNYSCLYSEA